MAIRAELAQWAAQHNVTGAALADLVNLLAGNDHAPPIAVGEASESRQQSLVRLEAPKHGFWLTRNNVGALMDERGVPVRYGLANESSAQNKQIKSGDLIGFRSKVIVAADVGSTIAQFASIECKHLGWVYRGDKHEQAQARWRDFINIHGGYAAFATGPEVFNHDQK